MKFKWTVEVDITDEYAEEITLKEASCAFSQAQDAFFQSFYSDELHPHVIKDTVKYPKEKHE